jgi:mono/diheme cytochrome c family protein
MTRGRLAIAVLVSLSSGLRAQDAPAPVDYARDVLPIFTRACVACHGPDKQKSNYRLDLKTSALGEASIGQPILPGRAADSPLLKYVSGADPDLRMPPKGPRLSEAEVSTLRRWIDQGATWPEDVSASARPAELHWSFRPIVRPASGSCIDDFLLARLRKEGLGTSPEADRRTLIRRLSFDVAGLPPSPEEIADFEADRRPDAYDRLVDRLLDSPRFGERWARHWLDVVRFAESHGFEMNQARPNAWPYRDYVIRAFNEDRPYDRFVREQLAGDLLGADAATGFLVGGPMDQVKSPDPVLTAQQRADELNDMVATTGTAFLGLTLGCARCHDHKFDPLPQADYTALVAVFAGVEHGERPIPPPDAAERLARAAALRAQGAPLQDLLSRDEPSARPGRALLVDAAGEGRKPYKAGNSRGCASDPGDERRLPTLGRGAVPAAIWTPGVAGKFRVWISWGSTAGEAPLLMDGQALMSVNLQVHPGPDLLWSGFKDAGVLDLKPDSRLSLRSGDTLLLMEDPAPATPSLRPPVTRGANRERFDPVEAKLLRFTVTETTQLEPCIDELEVFAGGVNVARGAVARASGTLPGFELHKLEHLNDGLYGNARSWISNERGRGWVELEFPRVERIDQVVWSRDRDNVPRYDDRLPTKYVIETSLDGKTWTRVASSDDRVPRGRIPGDVLRTLRPLSEAEAANRAETRKRLQALEAEAKALTAFPAVYAGRFVKPATIKRLHRGDVTQPREPVAPGLLTRIGPARSLPLEASEPQRRLALADWIVDPKNPLTARVIVNRLWHYHFGEGLVATPSDFGANGARPTHPELLDWLASELIARNWSLKSIHRLILCSTAWRQSSQSRLEGLAVDAGSRLLWRHPPRRLEAEALRDTVLSVSGALDLQMGGPGFDLFETNTSYVKVYVPRATFGPAEFRRMIYQNKPRMELDPVFGAFDCPDGGQVAPRRNVSTTPLQAMSLLNSAFTLQQAGLFSARLEREAPDLPGRVRRGFRLAFGRDPVASELEAASALARERGLPALCRALFNANEFVTVN